MVKPREGGCLGGRAWIESVYGIKLPSFKVTITKGRSLSVLLMVATQEPKALKLKEGWVLIRREVRGCHSIMQERKAEHCPGGS